jgi:hypothetical protein
VNYAGWQQNAMPMTKQSDGLKGHGLDATTADGENVVTGPWFAKMKDQALFPSASDLNVTAKAKAGCPAGSFWEATGRTRYQ